MKKVLLFFYFFLALGFTSKVVGQFAGGSGTAEDPYQISTPKHLTILSIYVGNANVHSKYYHKRETAFYT